MQPEIKTEATQYVATDHPLQKIAVSIAQVLIYPLLVMLRLLVVKNKPYSDKAQLNLRENGKDAKYVLYANHQSKLDPLIICACLPLITVKHLLPFRFFVENSYFKGTAKLFLNVMGGFPALYDADRPYGLDRAQSLLSSGQTIVIFPPGIRTRERIAKRGVSVLAAEPDVYLIPVHIDWEDRWHCQVHIGVPIRGGVTLPPEQLMQSVYELAG